MRLNLTAKELFFLTVAVENIIKHHEKDKSKETIEMVKSLKSSARHLRAVLLDKKDILKRIKMSILTKLRRDA